jgi:hypothetical protein
MAIPSKVASRIAAGIKRFQPILSSAKASDIGESDTAKIVTDLLQEVFGYDKFAEVTSEHEIKGTYVDLAIKIDGTLVLLLEIKAIGLDLRDTHVKQAVDYASNQGVDWVVLSNGVVWRVYRVHFTRPIDNELLYEFNFLELNPKNEDHLEMVWMLTKESWPKETLEDYHRRKRVLNRFVIAAALQTDTVMKVVRRVLKRVPPGIKIDRDRIEQILVHEVLKRDVIEGEKAEAARKLVAKAARKASKSGRKESAGDW